MDPIARKNMMSRVNAALGIADGEEAIERDADAFPCGFFKRRHPSPAQRPSISELIAQSMARRASQAVESMTFWCRVLILRVISNQPWYYFSWAVCHCKKGVSKFGNVFMCSSCEDVCTLPTARYKLQLEITNGVSNVVVTLVDEVAERLIKKPAQDLLAGNINTFHVMELKSHMYYHHGSYESFACSAIIKPIIGMKLLPAGVMGTTSQMCYQE